MISEKMKGYVKNSSVIRAMFEEGKKMAAIYGSKRLSTIFSRMRIH